MLLALIYHTYIETLSIYPTGSFTPIPAAVHGSGDLRLSELPGGGETRPGRGAPSEEEHPQLSHPRLREGLREDVSPQGAPAVAHGRAALRLQLVVLRQEIHEERRAAETSPYPHRREEVDL